MRLLLYFAVILGGFLVALAYQPDLLTDPEQVGYRAGGPDTLLSHLVTTTSLIGALVVFIVYWVRFNQWTGPSEAPAGFRPHPTSHSTTWLRYLLWASVYAGIVVSVYVFIILFPQVVVNLAPVFDSFGLDLPYLKEVRGLLQEKNPNPDDLVPYALILTLLGWGGLAKTPELKFRKRMQSLALIPTEGNSLVDRMSARFPPFEGQPSTIEQVIRETGRNLLVAQDFALEDRLYARFARCVYLHHQLTKLHDREAKTVAERHKAERAAIAKDINKLIKDTDELRSEQFDFLKNLNPDPAEETSFNVLKDRLTAARDASAFGLSEMKQLLDQYGNSEPYALRIVFLKAVFPV